MTNSRAPRVVQSATTWKWIRRDRKLDGQHIPCNRVAREAREALVTSHTSSQLHRLPGPQEAVVCPGPKPVGLVDESPTSQSPRPGRGRCTFKPFSSRTTSSFVLFSKVKKEFVAGSDASGCSSPFERDKSKAEDKQLVAPRGPVRHGRKSIAIRLSQKQPFGNSLRVF